MRWLAALALCAACGDDTDELTIRIENGTIHGKLDGNTRAFLGIPYAAPPIDDLRWRPPQPAPPIAGTHDATHIGEQCPQSFSISGVGAEDCLFLNVWAPRDAGSELPVMVWLHGGAFLFGSAGDPYYDGRFLAETYGIVIVSINYRLGPFGFLAHPELTAEDPAYPSSGNYGLEDQRAALQWVQRNISVFGGDPAKVTLFGESAGGFSTCVHYAFPRDDAAGGTENLFRAAISQSGLCASTIPEPTLAEAEIAGVRIMEKLGCDSIACLRGKTAKELREATAVPPRAEQDPGGPFYADPVEMVSTLPNVDGLVIPVSLRERFTGDALASLAARPLILGTNRDEGTLFHSVFFAASVGDETEYRDALARRFGAAHVDAIVAQYPVASFASANRALAEVTGDAFFHCPARRTARGVSQVGGVVFQYSFEHAPDEPFLDDLGVFHSSEIPFLFQSDAFPLGKIGSGQAVADTLQRYWTQFAITGLPDDGSWPAYDVETDRHLIIDTEISEGTGLRAAACDFWDALPLP